MDIIYWYFSYIVTVKSSGYERKDSGYVASMYDEFPLYSVMSAFKEELGDDAELTVLNVVPISRSDYYKLTESR